MLGVIYAHCRKLALYAECRYAECFYVDCGGAAGMAMPIRETDLTS
jgi:hypothetical protein